MPLPEHQEEHIALGMFDRGLLGFPEGGITLKSGPTIALLLQYAWESFVQ